MAPRRSSARFVVATRNEHKLTELGEILGGEVELVALDPSIELPPETGTTFADNALIKARAAHEATAAPALADDSGISATALDGRPGVLSARFAGPDATDEQNLELLLSELAGEDDRSAAYICVIAAIEAGGAERTFEGRCEGVVVDERRGSGGFGYDPSFVPDDTGPEDGRTMAELDADEKHAISHRGRAARALAEALRDGVPPSP